MSTNGDRITPVETWRTSDLAEKPLPQAISLIQEALHELDGTAQAWAKTFERQARMMIDQAAEQAGLEVYSKLLPELVELKRMIAEAGIEAKDAGDRASHAEIVAKEAKATADDTQRRPIVQVVNDIPTPLPPPSEVPEALKGFVSRQLWKRYRGVATVIMLVISIAYGVWHTLKGP